MVILYEQSVGFYNMGRYDKAKEGFTRVAASGLVESAAGESGEDYLVRIEKLQHDGYLGGVMTKRESDFWRQSSDDEVTSAGVSAGIEMRGSSETVPGVNERMVEAAMPFEESSEGVGQADAARASIVRMYVKAVVDDAIRKAAGFLSEGQYEKAQEAVKSAETIVEAKRDLTGEIVYQQNKSRLSQANSLIVSEQVRHLGDG
jgi:hypothetical protein